MYETTMHVTQYRYRYESSTFCISEKLSIQSLAILFASILGQYNEKMETGKNLLMCVDWVQVIHCTECNTTFAVHCKTMHLECRVQCGRNYEMQFTLSTHTLDSRLHSMLFCSLQATPQSSISSISAISSLSASPPKQQDEGCWSVTAGDGDGEWDV